MPDPEDFKVIDTILPRHSALVFESDSFSESLQIIGAFKATIYAAINKKDVDISIALYEKTPEGKYFYLSWGLQRASYAADKSVRHLLTPDKKTAIALSQTFTCVKQLAKGSKIVALVAVNNNPYYEINYGTGKAVSSETIADATIPLQIKWFTDSVIELPVWK